MTELHDTYPPQLGRIQRLALPVGGVCLLLCLIGAIFPHWRQQFFTSYLFAFIFWLGVTLGSLSIVMLHHLTDGAWGRAIRPAAEAAAMTLPLLFVGWIVVILGVRNLYPWANPGIVHNDPILQHQALYVNIPWFIIRGIIYFVIWTSMAFVLWRAGARLQRGPDPVYARSLRKVCAGGLVILILTISLASYDWMMTREAHWYSTVFGLLVSVAFTLSGMVFLIMTLAVSSQTRAMAGFITPQILIDLGNLFLTLVILWAYMAFAQLLVIWMGNTRPEATWYVRRGLGDQPNFWRYIGLAIVVLHFFVPFVLLLLRDVKRQGERLCALAAFVLFLRLVDTLWMTAPSSLQPDVGFHLSWMDFLMPAGVGGIWIWAFVALWRNRPIVARASADEPAEYREDANKHGHAAELGG